MLIIVTIKKYTTIGTAISEKNIDTAVDSRLQNCDRKLFTQPNPCYNK